MPSQPLQIPPELKKITQFIRRGEELDRDTKRPESRVVAYYCRQFAVQLGISLSKSVQATECLSEILTVLEGEKEALSVFSNDESRLICRNFAMEVFNKANAQELDGNADKVTAKTFYAAAVFLEILQHFDGKSDEDVNDEMAAFLEEENKKRIYSKWKATEILKAIKEGRKIEPGGYKLQDQIDDLDQTANTEPNDPTLAPLPLPPGLNADDEVQSEGVETSLDGPPQMTLRPPPPLTPPPLPPPPYDFSTKDDDDAKITNAPSNPPPPPVTSSKVTPIVRKRSETTKKKEMLADAMELTRFALAALEGKDMDLGKTRLQQALETLTGKETPKSNGGAFSVGIMTSKKKVISALIDKTNVILASLKDNNIDMAIEKLQEVLYKH